MAPSEDAQCLCLRWCRPVPPRDERTKRWRHRKIVPILPRGGSPTSYSGATLNTPVFGPPWPHLQPQPVASSHEASPSWRIWYPVGDACDVPAVNRPPFGVDGKIMSIGDCGLTAPRWLHGGSASRAVLVCRRAAHHRPLRIEDVIRDARGRARHGADGAGARVALEGAGRAALDLLP